MGEIVFVSFLWLLISPFITALIASFFSSALNNNLDENFPMFWLAICIIGFLVLIVHYAK